MSLVRQKQIFDGKHGITHYEITFTALAHDWITDEQYEEISELIDVKISAPNSFAAWEASQRSYDARSGMMAIWKMKAHEADVVWRGGFKAAWEAAGGNINDLK